MKTTVQKWSNSFAIWVSTTRMLRKNRQRTGSSKRGKDNR